MKILAVETATAYQSVAVVSGTQVLAYVARDAEGSHAKWLAPSIDETLQAAGLPLAAIDGLAVSIGPGSFTGLRVGLATLLGFRTVLGKPLVAVPTLEALAWNLRDAGGRVCPILKSRRNEVYWACYEWGPEQTLRTLSPAQVGSPEHAARTIQPPLVALGDGWEAYGNRIRTAVGPDGGLIAEAPRDRMLPSAVSVALAAQERFAQGDTVGRGIAPLYVQRPEAELKFEETGELSAIERRQERVARKSRPRYKRPGTHQGQGSQDPRKT